MKLMDSDSLARVKNTLTLIIALEENLRKAGCYSHDIEEQFIEIKNKLGAILNRENSNSIYMHLIC